MAMKVLMHVVFVAMACGQWAVGSQGQSLPCVSNGQPCSDVLCPNTGVQLTCNIPNNKLGSTTQWMTSSPNCTLELDQRITYNCSGNSSSCPPFTAVNAEVTSPNVPCNTSTLSFMMSPNLNGTLITCATAIVPGIIGSITLNSVAPPGQPSVSVAPGLYDLIVMWTPYGGSPTHYTITLMGAGSVVSSSTNLTSTRFTGLLSDAAFSIAVVAINCAGNATKYVTTGTLPFPPTSIGVEQIPQSTTTQLSITWTHVGGSVTQYNIMSSSQGYNVTSSPLVRDSCFESKCSFTQSVETTGALYIVTMASINAVGIGPWSDPKQGVITQQTSAVSVGVGVGVGLGMPIIMIFAATIAVLAYWLHRRSRNSITISGPPVAEHQLANLELRLYAVEWHDRPPGYESYCSPIYITHQLNGCVLELKDPPEDGHHVVASRRTLPPHDCQQWYLIDQSNDDTFMIVSKLNGRVLSSENDQKPSNECVLWRKDGGNIRSESRKDYVLGIYASHREPGYPVVLSEIRKHDDMNQQFDERPAIIPLYYIECQETCFNAKSLKYNHDSKNCTECYGCVEINNTDIFAGRHYTLQSTDAQRWCIDDQSDKSFLIVSKLNGKALYCKGGDGGTQVEATERDDGDDRQHWIRKDSYIVSKKWNKNFYKQPCSCKIFLFDVIKEDFHNSTRSSVAHDCTLFAIKNCSTNELCYIQDVKSDHVLDLEHEPNGSVCKSNGAAAVFNLKADPPTDSQQWYLHPLSNGHYLVVSKLHGKVLTYQIEDRKCFVSNSNGGQDQQWMKKEDSVVSVKYNFHVGKCVDIIADL